MNGKTCNIYFLDWKNQTADSRYRALADRYPNVYRVNMQDTLADTARILAKLSNLDYFWIVSSITDYSSFEFNDYSYKGLEPYLQVFGANTWLGSKHYMETVPNTIKYIEAFPNLHFVKTQLCVDKDPLDIVYISNGEPEAEIHYQQLIESVKTPNKMHRIMNINGRKEAYQAAAEVSSTPWFFAVFAKLEVNPNFDWLWQPMETKGPMHYIFHARNPVNGLEYGHMAVIAYNKFLTLATEHSKLDFTMTKPHDVVPTLSGTAHYDQDIVTTWRTAFRECIKLKQDGSKDAQHKLDVWVSKATGTYGIWSVRGARDAIEYYNSVKGDYNKLMLSYDWNWLNLYQQKKYKQ